MTLMQIKNRIVSFCRIISVALIPGLALNFFCLAVFAQLLPEERFSQFLSKEKPAKAELITDVKVEYTADNFRDPLRPQIVRPKAEEAEGLVAIEEEKPKVSEMLSLSLQGIIWNPDNPLAIINNSVVKIGDILLVPKDSETTEEVTIMDITKDEVTIIYLGEVERLPSPASLELRNIKGGKK